MSLPSAPGARWLTAWLALITVSLAAVPVASAAGRMPPYRGQTGDAIDDPVRLKSEARQFDAAFMTFKQASAEYRDEVREFIGDEIGKRQRKIAGTYQNQIEEIDKAQFKLRKEAIARLESFIFRHRDHDRYTPDALFRLGELYYEDSIAEYNRSQDNFDRDMDLYNRGKLLDPPEDKDKDFGRSIALYKYLHWMPAGSKMDPLSGRLEGVILPRRWPDYRNADAALYLQGFCEAEMGQYETAIATLSSLQKHYPNSHYIAEAWLRVGEMYFDNNEFEQAADAYKRAADTKDEKMYGLALYKLGWSYFQMYRYPEAVAWFQTLIEYYEDRDKGGTEAQKKSSQDAGLQNEAIEYLAKSLAEPSWDDDGCPDFGGEDSKGECPMVDPRLRARLYTSAVMPLQIDDFPNWQDMFQGQVLATMQANLAARADVRGKLVKDRPYVRKVLMEYGNSLLEQAEDDFYRQGIVVLSHVIDRYPLAREAQALQKKVIRAVDLLAAAGTSFRLELKKDPNNAEAQVGLEMAEKAMDTQIEERRKYLRLFSPGGEWYTLWGKDKDLARQVDEMVAQVRLNFAKLIHSQAQTLRAAGREEQALRKYSEAAKEYETLLLADPEAAGAYELAWTLADVLFFAGRRCDGIRNKDGDLRVGADEELLAYPADIAPVIKEACESLSKSVKYFNMVRDWKSDKGKDDEGKGLNYTEEAAFSSIIATERILNARAALPLDEPDRLPARMVPEIRPSSEQDARDAKNSEKSTKVVRVQRQELAKAVVDWLRSVDGYIGSGMVNTKEPDRAQKLALKAAELLYKNRHFDPWKEGATEETPPDFWSARVRFWWIMKNHPKAEQAIESAKNLLTSYEIERDFDELRKVADFVDKNNLGSAEQIKLVRDQIEIFSLGVLARNADQLFKEAEEQHKVAESEPDPDRAAMEHKKARQIFEKAGDEYRTLRAKTKETEQKLASLMNAQLLYHRAERWDKCFDVLDEAEKMLREVNETEKDSKERAKNHDRLIKVIKSRAALQFDFFRIPESIANYRTLYELDPKGEDGENALLNAANLAFSNGNWDLSVDLNRTILERFGKDKKREDVVLQAAWRIPEAYQKKGDSNGYINELRGFAKRYVGDPKVSSKVFRAEREIALIYRSRGDKKNELKQWESIIKAFEKGGFEKNGGPEASAAAEGQFWLMEDRYNKYLNSKLIEKKKLSPTKRMKDLQEQVKNMVDEATGKPTKRKNPETGQPEEVRLGGLYNDYVTNVASYGSRNWSYAAFLYRAQVLRHLARTIYTAPTPKDLSDEEQEALMEVLEQIGGQIENRAISSLEIAMKDADSKGVVNEWVTKLRTEINRYKPAEYPLLKEAKRLVVDPPAVAPAPEKELR